MKKASLFSAIGLLIATGIVFAESVRESFYLTRAHQHLISLIDQTGRVAGETSKVVNELERDRVANHYDMAGHGLKAEDLARQAANLARQVDDVAHKAELELGKAVEAAKAEK